MPLDGILCAFGWYTLSLWMVYFVPLDGILCAFGWYTLCLWMVYFEPLDGILNYLSKEKILLMDKSRNNYCKVVF